MLLRTMTFVTTRQSSNKFDFALAAPKVLSPASYESGNATGSRFQVYSLKFFLHSATKAAKPSVWFQVSSFKRG